MLGYLTTCAQDDRGFWLVRLVGFDNVVGHAASRSGARIKALAALVQWIDILIANGWPVPTPVDASDDENLLVINFVLVLRILVHNEMHRRPPDARGRAT